VYYRHQRAGRTNFLLTIDVNAKKDLEDRTMYVWVFVELRSMKFMISLQNLVFVEMDMDLDWLRDYAKDVLLIPAQVDFLLHVSVMIDLDGMKWWEDVKL